MSKISVVMLTYNVGRFVADAIESVLCQSFTDFEFIIVDGGSEDDTLSIIRSYSDIRIKLIENKHDYAGALNLGIQTATGRYIAHMGETDRMHVDRLRIQYAIMEEEPDITVCGSWVSFFGKEISNTTTSCIGFGLLEHPLLLLLKYNIITYSSAMIRTEFLRCHSLQYEACDCAEDYKLWLEVAKLGGIFYIEPQPLLYCRLSDGQNDNRKRVVEMETSNRIKRELLEYVIRLNHADHPSFMEIFTSLTHAKEENLLNEDEIFYFFFKQFERNRNSLILE